MEVLSTDRSVYDTITQKIVAMMDEGGGSYRAPWHARSAGSFPVNATTHAPYRGVNVLSLWIDAQVRGFGSPYWASYRQWQSVGAQVRKGERGSVIVFYKKLETQAFEEDDPDRTTKLRFVARASYVFNAAQVDGFAAEPQPEQQSDFQRVQEVEAFVTALNAHIQHGTDGACYGTDIDIIEMPHRERFVASASSTAEQNYYAVLLHELTHWVGAPHRLNRQFGRRFGDEAYAMEELVAELGAAFLCAAFGISTEPRPDHAAYVSSWLRVLNRDHKAIFTAASKAQEAFEHLAYLATKPDERVPR